MLPQKTSNADLIGEVSAKRIFSPSKPCSEDTRYLEVRLTALVLAAPNRHQHQSLLCSVAKLYTTFPSFTKSCHDFLLREITAIINAANPLQNMQTAKWGEGSETRPGGRR
jgi:hypothetical protein